MLRHLPSVYSWYNIIPRSLKKLPKLSWHHLNIGMFIFVSIKPPFRGVSPAAIHKCRAKRNLAVISLTGSPASNPPQTYPATVLSFRISSRPPSPSDPPSPSRLSFKKTLPCRHRLPGLILVSYCVGRGQSVTTG